VAPGGFWGRRGGKDIVAFEVGGWLPDGTYELCGPKVRATLRLKSIACTVTGCSPV